MGGFRFCHPDRSEAEWRDLRFPFSTENAIRIMALSMNRYPEESLRKTATAILMTLILSCVAFAADTHTYSTGKVVKWENGSYAQNSGKKPMKNWIIYQLQTDSTTYSIARKKETKPQMQAGDVVQYELKKNNQINVITANGSKREYQIVGQIAGPGQ
jgi:hypothetical protein